MQKKGLILLGAVLLIILFFAQYDGAEKGIKDMAVGQTPAAPKTKMVQNHMVKTVVAPEIPNTHRPVKPFLPSIDLDPKIPPRESVEEIDTREIESKSERELQKEIFADLELRMTAEMQTIPDCLEKAQSKNEALNCSKKLHSINKEFELILGIERDDAEQNQRAVFIWDETTKESMIRELDAGVQSMHELFSCIQASDTDMEKEKCFEVE